MTNGTKDSTIKTSVVIFLRLLLVFESTSGNLYAHQLIHQVRIECSEFKDDIHVDDTPIEELQVDGINGGPSVKAPPVREREWARESS